METLLSNLCLNGGCQIGRLSYHEKRGGGIIYIDVYGPPKNTMMFLWTMNDGKICVPDRSKRLSLLGPTTHSNIVAKISRVIGQKQQTKTGALNHKSETKPPMLATA